MLLLDSGVWLAARDRDDPFHEASVTLLDAAVERPNVAALDLSLYEVANVATVRWRSQPEAERLVKLIMALVEGIVGVDDDLVRAAASVAAEHGLTVYDGAYVACARARGWDLVSTDVADLVRLGHARSPEQALT